MNSFAMYVGAVIYVQSGYALSGSVRYTTYVMN